MTEETVKASEVLHAVEGDWFVARRGEETLRARFVDARRFVWEADGREVAAEAWLARYRTWVPNYEGEGIKAIEATCARAKQGGSICGAATGWRVAAELGSTTAANELGACLQNDELGWKDPEGVFQFFKRGAELNDKMCLRELARCYFLGNGVERDEKKFLETLCLAAENGDLAVFQQAIMEVYYAKEALPKWTALTRRWIEIAMRQISKDVRYVESIEDAKTKEEKNAVALRFMAFQLALHYLNGVGIERDPTEANKYFQISADYGSPQGLFEVGVCAINGEGRPVDRAYGLNCLRLSALRGDVYAMRDFGFLTTHANDSTDEEKAEGVRWLRLAAQRLSGDEKKAVEYYLLGLKGKINLSAVHGDPQGWEGDFHADDYRSFVYRNMKFLLIFFLILGALALLGFLAQLL